MNVKPQIKLNKMKIGDIVLYKKEPNRYGPMMIERDKAGGDSCVCKILDPRFATFFNIVINNEELEVIYSTPKEVFEYDEDIFQDEYQISEITFRNGAKEYKVKGKTNGDKCFAPDFKTLAEAQMYIDEIEGKKVASEEIICYRPDYNTEIIEYEWRVGDDRYIAKCRKKYIINENGKRVPKLDILNIKHMTSINTGFRDMDNNEIREGDIIESIGKKKYYINWHPRYNTWMASETYSETPFKSRSLISIIEDNPFVRIIGNIRDNPELLENKNK